MTPLREAAQQALDALEGVVRVADRATQEFADARTAIADLRAALAEPVPPDHHEAMRLALVVLQRTPQPASRDHIEAIVALRAALGEAKS